MQKNDKKFIEDLVKLQQTYQDLTYNTNALFRKKLSEQLAIKMGPYKFHDFVGFISDAEVIQRLR